MTPALLATDILACLIYGITIYLVSWATAFLLLKNQAVVKSTSPADNRYGSIDGLRGALAVSVLVHHSYMAYDYFISGYFRSAPNPLLFHFGKSSVALFFMITGFLFTNKSLQSSIDWISFYKARFKRLFPLYAVVVTLVFLIVLIIDNFNLRVSCLKLIIDYFMWLSFVVFGRPEINGMKDSVLLIAGVNWSLKYEVLFYIVAVPIIFFVSKRMSIWKLIISCIGFGAVLILLKGFVKNEMTIIWLLYFLGGILIALLYRNEFIKKIFIHKYMRILGFMSLMMLSVTNLWGVSFILLLVIFSSILGGGSLFGLFNTRPSIWLGDISYGVYLLHGLILFASFSLLKNMGYYSYIDIWIFWAIIILAATVSVVLASLSYIFLEKPIMNSGKK